MKRILLSIILVLAWTTGAWAVDYFACAAGEVHANNVWCTAAHANGSCSNDGTTEADTAAILVAGNSFYANGCAMTITSGFTVDKISTEANGEVAGGSFTITAAGTYTFAIGTIKGGTTDCLVITGGANDITVNINTVAGGGTITADATTGADGIYVTGSDVKLNIGKSGTPTAITGGAGNNSAIADAKTVRTATIYATITGGTASNAKGYLISGASGGANITGNISGNNFAGSHGIVQSNSSTVVITGNCTGGGYATGLSQTYGCYNSSTSGTAIMTVAGDCIGGSTYHPGCAADGPGTITVTGNLVDTETAVSTFGRIIWSPSAATKYVKKIGDGTPAQYYLTSNVAGGAHPPVADVKLGTTYGWDGAAVYTGELATTGGGGGAWSF